MTTFTSDDREEAYKIVANKPGYEDAVPISFNGLASNELTDEEITDLFRASFNHIEFARALLKKANKK